MKRILIILRYVTSVIRFRKFKKNGNEMSKKQSHEENYYMRCDVKRVDGKIKWDCSMPYYMPSKPL